MRRLLSSLVAIAFLVFGTYAMASNWDAASVAFDPAPLVNPEVGNIPTITTYTPTLQIQFPHYFSSQAQGITWDGTYYYACGYDAAVETYDANGGFVRSVTIGINAVRSVWMYNNQLYLKGLSLDLFTVDPVTGTTTTVMPGFFHDTNAECCYLNGYVYEHLAGTIWKIDITNGTTVQTITLSPNYVYGYPIATNGTHLFFEGAFTGTTIYVYNFDGSYV